MILDIAHVGHCMVVGPTLRVQPYSIAHLASSLHPIHCHLCVVFDSNGVSGAHTDQSCCGASRGVFGNDGIGSRVVSGAEMGVGCVGCVCGGACASVWVGSAAISQIK